MRLSEQLTYCTTKITSKYSNGTIGTGTGFFVNFNYDKETGGCQPVIITNKHVVRDAVEISFNVCLGDGNNNPIDTKKLTLITDNKYVINHPSDDVDLCAISIADLLNQANEKNFRLFRSYLFTDLIISESEVNECSAMEDIVMVGYPNGLEDEYNNKPIIRRGITSTHLKFNYTGKKEFLMDIACFPGSSGSPIFFCNENSYTKGNSVVIGSRISLIGILYAGPQHRGTGEIIFENIPTNPKTFFRIPNNLGLAIKAERIKELEDLFKVE